MKTRRWATVRSRPGRFAWPALLAFAFAACGEGSGSQPAVSVRDSAGIRIVENTGNAAARLGWTVDAQPAVEIGAQGRGAELYQVTSAFRTRDGRIVAANTGTSQVRIYAADGRPLRSVGRSGGGPGEFNALFWVGPLPGDSIGAWDAALGRLSVLSPAGEFVRTVTPRKPLGMFPQVHGALPDGRLVVAAGSGQVGAVSAEPRVRRDTMAFVLLARDGAVADTVGRFPGPEMLLVAPDGAGLLVRPLPFGRQTVAAVRNGEVVVGTGDRFELAAYAPERGLRTLVRVARPAVPVTPGDVAAYRETLVTLGAEGDATFQRQQRQLLERAPYPETMPPFTALRHDGDGNLWLQEPQTPGGQRPSRWTILAADGAVRGTVEVPHGLSVLHIGPDWVLGVAFDADGAERLRLHRIRKP